MKQNLKQPLLLFVFIFVTSGVVIGSKQRNNQPLPLTLTRLPEVELVEIKDEAGQVVLSGKFKTAIDTKNVIERVARLAGIGGAIGAKGQAEIELVKNGDTFSRQEMEVSVYGLAKSANFKIFVDGAEVITFTTNKNGKADMKFSDQKPKK